MYILFLFLSAIFKKKNKINFYLQDFFIPFYRYLYQNLVRLVNFFNRREIKAKKKDFIRLYFHRKISQSEKYSVLNE